jgi:hypothetical protein
VASLVGFPDDLSHYACFNWFVKWGFMADEHGPVRGLRSLCDEIVRNRPPRLERQWQDIGSTGLRLCQANYALAPVYIVELQVDDFAGSKTEVH